MFGSREFPSLAIKRLRRLMPGRRSGVADLPAYQQHLLGRGGRCVYDFAAHLAEGYGYFRLVDLGAEYVATLVRHPKDGPLFPGDESRWRDTHYTVETFNVQPDRGQLRDSLVICTGALDYLASPAHLLATLRDLLDEAPLAIVTAGLDGKWSSPKFRDLLEGAGLEILFHGLTSTSNARRDKSTLLSVVRKPRPTPRTPDQFRVIALVAAYNEEDVIEPFLEHTIGQGVEVCLLDNWSTDRTTERAARFLGRGVTSILKFPADGPIQTHEWRAMLVRKAELARELDADWFIHLDPDEIRESPWRDVSLRDAIYRADQDGFNAIDHTILLFHPTGGGFREDRPIQDQFSHFEFGAYLSNFIQVKAWKRQAVAVDCATSGGHEVCFPGRRVYPFKFLLRHYPIRSQEHGEKKVFQDRLPRFNPELRKIGWHVQYDSLRPGSSFVRSRRGLISYDSERFEEQFLLERISGVGIQRHPHGNG